MKCKNAILVSSIAVFIFLFIYFATRGENSPPTIQPISKMTKEENILDEKRRKTHKALEETEKKLQRAYKKLDKTIAKLNEKNHLESQKKMDEAKKLQTVQRKMERKNEELWKDEEKLKNWKEKQEEKNKQERDEILLEKRDNLEEISGDKREIEKKIQDEQANQIALQLKLKEENENLKEMKNSAKNEEDQEKIREKEKEIEEIKQKIGENQISKLDLKKKLVVEKAKESSDEIAIRHLEEEKVKEIERKAEEIERELEDDKENEEKREKRKEDIEDKVKELKKGVYIDKTTHNEEDAKIKEQQINEEDLKLERNNSELERERESEDEDLKELHDNQREKREVEIQKEKFELKKFVDSQKSAEHNIFETKVKENQLQKEISSNLKNSPLNRNDTTKLESKLAQLEDLKETEKFQKEFSEYFMRNKPKISKHIIDLELSEIRSDIANKNEELNLKKKHELDIKEEAGKVRSDIQELKELDGEDLDQKIQLKRKQIREKELQDNLKNELEDEEELEKEIQSKKENYEKIKEVEDNDTILDRLEQDRMDKESIISSSTESPKDLEKLKDEIKEDFKAEEKIKEHIKKLDHQILQNEIDDNNRLKEIAETREKYYNLKVRSEKENIKELDAKIDKMKSLSNVDNPELILKQAELEILKEERNYDERKEMIEDRDAHRADFDAKDKEREQRQEEAENDHDIEWDNEVKHFDDDEINVAEEDESEVDNSITDSLKQNKQVLDNPQHIATLVVDSADKLEDELESETLVNNKSEDVVDTSSVVNKKQETDEEHNLATEKLNLFDDSPKKQENKDSDSKNHEEEISKQVNRLLSSEIEKEDAEKIESGDDSSKGEMEKELHEDTVEMIDQIKKDAKKHLNNKVDPQLPEKEDSSYASPPENLIQRGSPDSSSKRDSKPKSLGRATQPPN
eukprot:TRINITY_DN4074_c0_g1_i1.p1 TRINITY_DN4074_c0_g1~~TRINITY_DN4074_c0_g1_i1.p1  ORF type:complete len:922 (-),score=434.22 TRINITY_DN4074_c0_g1_i1:116-2881(-)